MKIRRIGDRYLLRGEIGDQLPHFLVQSARDHGWTSGYLTGIGGVKDVELAYFDLERKEYTPIQVKGIQELISLSGNLALVGSEPFWHLHAAVSDRSGRVTAGHVQSMTVAITLECWAVIGDERVDRKFDDATRLNLLDT